MGKTRRGHKEYSREQELKHENQKLKREVSALRRQLARLDLDRHSYIKDMVDEHLAQEDQNDSASEMLKTLKEQWKCKKCSVGYLEIIPYSKMGETWYRRECSECDNITPGQLYTPSVKGIIKNTPKR